MWNKPLITMPRYERSKPLLVTIFILVAYIFYLHLSGTWVPTTQPTKTSKNEDNARAEALVQAPAPAPPPIKVEALQKHEDPKPKALRIAIVTMQTRETSYDILSLSNKFSTRFRIRPLEHEVQANHMREQRTRTNMATTSKLISRARECGIS